MKNSMKTKILCALGLSCSLLSPSYGLDNTPQSEPGKKQSKTDDDGRLDTPPTPQPKPGRKRHKTTNNGTKVDFREDIPDETGIHIFSDVLRGNLNRVGQRILPITDRILLHERERMVLSLVCKYWNNFLKDDVFNAVTCPEDVQNKPRFFYLPRDSKPLPNFGSFLSDNGTFLIQKYAILPLSHDFSFTDTQTELLNKNLDLRGTIIVYDDQFQNFFNKLTSLEVYSYTNLLIQACHPLFAPLYGVFDNNVNRQLETYQLRFPENSHLVMANVFNKYYQLIKDQERGGTIALMLASVMTELRSLWPKTYPQLINVQGDFLIKLSESRNILEMKANVISRLSILDTLFKKIPIPTGSRLPNYKKLYNIFYRNIMAGSSQFSKGKPIDFLSEDIKDLLKSIESGDFDTYAFVTYALFPQGPLVETFDSQDKLAILQESISRIGKFSKENSSLVITNSWLPRHILFHIHPIYRETKYGPGRIVFPIHPIHRWTKDGLRMEINELWDRIDKYFPKFYDDELKSARRTGVYWIFLTDPDPGEFDDLLNTYLKSVPESGQEEYFSSFCRVRLKGLNYQKLAFDIIQAYGNSPQDKDKLNITSVLCGISLLKNDKLNTLSEFVNNYVIKVPVPKIRYSALIPMVCYWDFIFEFITGTDSVRGIGTHLDKMTGEQMENFVNRLRKISTYVVTKEIWNSMIKFRDVTPDSLIRCLEALAQNDRNQLEALKGELLGDNGGLKVTTLEEFTKKAEAYNRQEKQRQEEEIQEEIQKVWRQIKG
jgi:hypothetical protein